MLPDSNFGDQMVMWDRTNYPPPKKSEQTTQIPCRMRGGEGGYSISETQQSRITNLWLQSAHICSNHNHH